SWPGSSWRCAPNACSSRPRTRRFPGRCPGAWHSTVCREHPTGGTGWPGACPSPAVGRPAGSSTRCAGPRSRKSPRNCGSRERRPRAGRGSSRTSASRTSACAYRSAPATSSSTRSGPSNGRRPPLPPGRSPRTTPTSASRSGSPRATRTTTSWGTRRNSSSPTPSTSTNGTWSSCGCATRPAVPASRTTPRTPRTRTCRRSRSELSPDEGRALGGPPTAGTTNRVRTRPSELLGRAVGERKGRRPVGPYRASEIRVAELRAQRLESGHLVLAEASDVVAVLLGGEERRRPGLGVELVRVHHQPLLHRLRQVVGGRQRQPLLQDVVPGESHSGVVGAEPAQGLGEFLPLEDLVSQQAVPDVVAVVEPSVGPVEAVDPDVVEETAGADQLGVHM